MDQAIRAYAQGVAKTRNRVARNVRKPDAESRSLVQHAKDGSQLRKGLWIILAICTERLVVEIKPEDRDLLIATARAAEQQVAELKRALAVILPMAKGYATDHPVGNNAAMVAWAAEILETKK